MKLSFLIPVYNGASYIGTLVESISSQINEKSFNDVEIVLFNDGSTDNSLEIIQKLSQQYKNISCYTQKNMGIGPTRNNLLRKATGTFVWYVDQDDVVIDGSLNKVLDAVDEKYDMINVGSMIVFPNGKICKKYLPDGTEENNGLDFINHGYRDPNPWDKILRREFILEKDLSFGKYSGMDDFFMSFTYLSVCGRIRTLRCYGYKHILNPTSYSNIDSYKVRLEWSEGSLVLAKDIKKYILSRPYNDQMILNKWFSVWMLGFLYSLVRYKYVNKYEYKMIDRLKKEGLYPIINRSSSIKLRIITFFINTRWGFYLSNNLYR